MSSGGRPNSDVSSSSWHGGDSHHGLRRSLRSASLANSSLASLLPGSFIALANASRSAGDNKDQMASGLALSEKKKLSKGVYLNSPQTEIDAFPSLVVAISLQTLVILQTLFFEPLKEVRHLSPLLGGPT